MDAHIGYLALRLTADRYGDRATRGISTYHEPPVQHNSTVLAFMEGSVAALKLAQPFVDATYELLEELALPEALRNPDEVNRKAVAAEHAAKHISSIRRNVITGQEGTPT